MIFNTKNEALEFIHLNKDLLEWAKKNKPLDRTIIIYCGQPYESWFFDYITNGFY